MEDEGAAEGGRPDAEGFEDVTEPLDAFVASIVPKACIGGFESVFDMGGALGAGELEGGVFNSDPFAPPFTLPKLRELPIEVR